MYAPLKKVRENVRFTSAEEIVAFEKEIMKLSYKAVYFNKARDVCEHIPCIVSRTIFPDKWKEQMLVLQPKSNKSSHEPTVYRPIALLDIIDKVYEKLIRNRIEKSLERCNGQSNFQLGFRKMRSSVDAIKMVINITPEAIEWKRWMESNKNYFLVITLNIENSFNSEN